MEPEGLQTLKQGSGEEDHAKMRMVGMGGGQLSSQFSQVIFQPALWDKGGTIRSVTAW